MKKIIILVLSIISVFLLHLSIRYVINEAYISKSNKGYYDSTLVENLFVLNWPESYIAYYNKGNNYYNKNEYENAIKEYEKALKTVTKKRVCKVRNNLSLSYMKLLDQSKETYLEDIEKIQKILLGNGCAAEDLVSGKNENSQTIYNELEDLKKQNPGGGEGPDDPNDPNDPQDPDDPKEKELEKEIKKQREKTQKDRNEKERDRGNINGYKPYTGKNY